MAGFTPVTSMQRTAMPDFIGVDQLKRKNALAERGMAVDEGNAEAYRNQLQMAAENQRRNALAQDQESKSAQDKEAWTQAYSLTQYAKQMPQAMPAIIKQLGQNPLISSYLQQQGATADQITPEDLDELAVIAASQLGIVPEQPVQYEQMEGPRGSILQRDPRTGEMKQVIGPDNTPNATPSVGPQFRALSQEEVIQAGLPAGTAAQQNTQTGQIQVLSKRDATGGLSQKDMTTAKQKLNTVNIARQQLQNIKDRFEELRNTRSAGPFGQGRLPTARGRAFDAAVDQMRSTLTALTRVPGVGAMSDYETRLDQAKFPDRKNYESVTEQQIRGIEQLLNGIEGGYTDLLGGSTQTEDDSPEQAEITATGPNGQKIILRDGQWVPL